MTIKNNLENSKNEKDVENNWKEKLHKLFKNSSITSPFGCDGLLCYSPKEKTTQVFKKPVRCLLEFKYDDDLINKKSQCKILCQELYYLKKFEDNGNVFPTTIFIANKNKCFAIHTNSIISYLSWDLDWTIAPSEAYKSNQELINTMTDDKNILPFVFDVNEKFHIVDVVEQIIKLNEGVKRKIRITHHNITQVFVYFEKVLCNEEKKKLNTNEQANLFIQLIINPNDNYKHPNKKNCLVTKCFGEICINGDKFESLFEYFEGVSYSPKEKEIITGFADRLIEDISRRRHGEFFTPTEFVDLAHKYVSETFGDDWKEKYIIWDCAWGTGNLTRDYKFKELYCSTLHQSDIDTSNQMKYNLEAIKFQFDFLNDDDFKLPKSLREAIENEKEILFFINPPYKRVSNMKYSLGINKKDICNSKVYNEMKKVGNSAEQLYTQFLYKILKYQIKNKNIKIAIFCPATFLTGQAFLKFRIEFLENFGFESGFLFSASNFSDVSKCWGILFSLWNKLPNSENYIVDIIENNNDFSLIKIGQKQLYNIDNKETLSKWVRKETNKLKTYDVINLKSALNVSNVEKTRSGKCIQNYLGYLNFGANNIEKNKTHISIYSSAGSGGLGLSIIKENFYKTLISFTARLLIIPNWINSMNEYQKPNEEHKKWEQFKIDSIIYSLFNNNKSQQSSLRQVEYKNRLWDIKNEFFWMSKVQILELAEKYYYDELYKDVKTSYERFVYKKLYEEGIYDKLSDDARDVIDTANDLVIKSIEMRKLMSKSHPEYHLDSWDAGYAQLKLVWKEYFKDEFKDFRNKYKKFEERLRPLVYELGFLRK